MRYALSAPALVLLTMTLAGCVTSGSNDVTLATIPGDIIVCFNKMVPAPKQGALSKQDVVKLIADLKKSEAAKSQCGQRLINFYDAQKRVFEGK